MSYYRLIKNSSKKDQYPIWIRGDKILLENGEFINNKSLSEVIVHESARNVILKKIKFGYGDLFEDLNKKKAIVNIQEYGKTTVIDCDFSQIKGKKIDDRNNKIYFKNKGL